MFNAIEKNKLLSVIRFGTPPKYMNLLKKEAVETGFPIADVVLNILEWDGSYKALKIHVMVKNGKMQSFIKDKIVKYYRKKEKQKKENYEN